MGSISLDDLQLAVVMRGHVSGQVMPLAEVLAANWAAQLLLALLAHRVALAPMLRPHVVHQVRGHAETEIALGAHVLRRGTDGTARHHGRSHHRRRGHHHWSPRGAGLGANAAGQRIASGRQRSSGLAGRATRFQHTEHGQFFLLLTYSLN